jgi:hypothetical protein
MMGPQEMQKLMQGTTGEYIPVKPAVAEATVQQSIFEVPYPRIDPGLFDLMPIKTELEALWGIQEALSSTITVAKTATEAEIQQAGTNARTGAMRERMEQQLSAIAKYHSQIAIQKYKLAEVRDIAGPEAIWLDGIEVEDLDVLLSVEIAAGSTGKPNTSAQREAWAATAEVIVNTITQVATLRQTSPLDQANCLIEVMRETVMRAGDESLDLDRFIPPVGEPMQLMDIMTGQMVLAYPAPQQPGMAPGAAPGMAPAGLPAAGEDDAGAAVSPTDLPPGIM